MMCSILPSKRNQKLTIKFANKRLSLKFSILSIEYMMHTSCTFVSYRVSKEYFKN